MENVTIQDPPTLYIEYVGTWSSIEALGDNDPSAHHILSTKLIKELWCTWQLEEILLFCRHMVKCNWCCMCCHFLTGHNTRCIFDITLFSMLYRSKVSILYKHYGYEHMANKALYLLIVLVVVIDGSSRKSLKRIYPHPRNLSTSNFWLLFRSPPLLIGPQPVFQPPVVLLQPLTSARIQAREPCGSS